jgi:hypothetical protein
MKIHKHPGINVYVHDENVSFSNTESYAVSNITLAYELNFIESVVLHSQHLRK